MDTSARRYADPLPGPGDTAARRGGRGAQPAPIADVSSFGVVTLPIRVFDRRETARSRLASTVVPRRLVLMCHHCWRASRTAAWVAFSRLQDASRFFTTGSGRNEPPHYRAHISAVQGAVAGLLVQGEHDDSMRATDADVAVLERARNACGLVVQLLATACVGEEEAYRDFSRDQMVLDQAIRTIKESWIAKPDEHVAPEPPASPVPLSPLVGPDRG
jgi:hypothetical protein